MGVKQFHIRFDKTVGFPKIHDKIRYLILFDYIYLDKICIKIKYLISKKSGITDKTYGFIEIHDKIRYVVLFD